jgi:hypothetical protein
MMSETSCTWLTRVRALGMLLAVSRVETGQWFTQLEMEDTWTGH